MWPRLGNFVVKIQIFLTQFLVKRPFFNLNVLAFEKFNKMWLILKVTLVYEQDFMFAPLGSNLNLLWGINGFREFFIYCRFLGTYLTLEIFQKGSRTSITPKIVIKLLQIIHENLYSLKIKSIVLIIFLQKLSTLEDQFDPLPSQTSLSRKEFVIAIFKSRENYCCFVYLGCLGHF